MIMAAIFSIVIVTTLTVAIGPQTWTGSDDSPAATSAPVPSRHRRDLNRGAG